MMKRIFQFLEYEESTFYLAFLRVGIGLIAILKFLVYGDEFLRFHGQYGIITWAVSKASIYDYLPHLADLALGLSRYTGQDLDSSAMTIFYLYIACCSCLIIGFLTRLMTFLVFFLHLSLIYAASGYMYGVDVFTQITLFYCLFFPLGSNYAVDNYLKISPKKETSQAAGILVRLIQLQLCMVYTSTGIEKSLGEQWWNGEAIWRTMMLPTFSHFDFSWLANYPVLPMIVGWSVLFFESGYSLFVWIPKFRTVALCSILLMHLSIGLLMGMWLFALIMILLNLFAFGKFIWQDLQSFRKIENKNSVKIL